MKKNCLLLLLVLSFPILSIGQDFNCRVQVIHPQVQIVNKQRITNLENSIREFINNKKWSTDLIQSNERIEWNLIITITEYDNVNTFKATAQIQSSRPVYGTSYNSVLLNHEDPSWQFDYIDFQPMDYIEGTYSYNLTSLVAYYIFIVMGLDADSYRKEGGTEFYNRANSVLLAAQQRGVPGWQTMDDGGSKNKYWLIENLLNERFKPVREAYYFYHMKGMDVMAKDVEEGRLEITKSLQLLQKVWKIMPNSMLLKVWFNAKVEEIVNVYCKALTVDKNKVIEILKEADPANGNKYEAIRNCN